MKPNHHIPDEWVVAYANGRCTEAEAIVVATHLTFCPVCRERVAIAEAAAAAALTEVAPAEMDMSALDALMARLDEPEPEPEPAPTLTDPVLPWPILRHTGPVADLNWSWLAPNVTGVDLPQPTDGLPLRLIKMKSGTRMHHGHAGNEASVVLQGGWSDQFGEYRRGDAAFYAADIEGNHEQHIHDDGDCIALVLNEERAVFSGLAGNLAKLVLKI